MDTYYAGEVEKAKKREAFENVIKEQLRTEDRFVQYFSNYSEKSVALFIDNYAKQKAQWYESVNSFWHLSKNKDSKWYISAKMAIDKIAEKKVFNQMCRWLMQEVSFPNIEVTRDWDYWLNNPLFFPFAEPIEKGEVDTYMQFIGSLDPSINHDIGYTCSSYTPTNYVEELEEMEKRKDDPTQEEYIDYYQYSRWFRYYDEQLGTDFVKRVPVTKMKREFLYFHYKTTLARDPNLVNEWDKEGFVYPKHLSSEAQQVLMDKYVKQYETYENKMHYEGWKWSRETDCFTESVQGLMFSLQEENGYIPIESNEDWRNGLIYGYEMFRRGKLLDALPHAYDEYFYLLSHKLGFVDWVEEKESFVTADSLTNYKATILEARLLQNEPVNFDFW